MTTFAKPSEGLAREMRERADAWLSQVRRDREAPLVGVEIQDKNGISWHEAPRPSRFHRCKAQTRGWIGFDLVERCRCGAIRRGRDRFWIHKNSRGRR